MKLQTTYCVRDCNVDKTFQDYRTELVHNLYHWFIIILQLTKYEITICKLKYKCLLSYINLNFAFFRFLPQTVRLS